MSAPSTAPPTAPPTPPPDKVAQTRDRLPSRPTPLAAGLFVTGTDTGVGKSVLAGSLLASMTTAGHAARAHKAVLSGLEELTAWPPDHELLAAMTGQRPDEVAPLRFRAAVSPHLAARLDGRDLSDAAVLSAARRALEDAARLRATLVVEGAGGLLAPLTDHLSVRDLAAALDLPVLIAARPGLGTINHTLLTIAAARAARLSVRAVVITPWPDRPGAVERSNRETIARLGEVEVAVLPAVGTPARADLALAGRTLPWREWLAPGAGADSDGYAVQLRVEARAAASIPAHTVATSSASIT